MSTGNDIGQKVLDQLGIEFRGRGVAEVQLRLPAGGPAELHIVCRGRAVDDALAGIDISSYEIVPRRGDD